MAVVPFSGPRGQPMPDIDPSFLQMAGAMLHAEYKISRDAKPDADPETDPIGNEMQRSDYETGQSIDALNAEVRLK